MRDAWWTSIRPETTSALIGKTASSLHSAYLQSCRHPRHQPIPRWIGVSPARTGSSRRRMPHTVQARSRGEYASPAVSAVRVERRTHDAARGYAVVATLGQRALAGTDFPLLLDQTVSLVAETLRVAAAAIGEVTADGSLLVRAAHGLTTIRAGETALAADRSRFPASALDSETPLCESPNRRSLNCDVRLTREALSNTVAIRTPGRAGPYVAGLGHSTRRVRQPKLALQRKLASPACEPELAKRAKAGGPDRDRTGDLVNAIHARSQLRHWPTLGGLPNTQW